MRVSVNILIIYMMYNVLISVYGWAVIQVIVMLVASIYIHIIYKYIYTYNAVSIESVVALNFNENVNISVL